MRSVPDVGIANEEYIHQEQLAGRHFRYMVNMAMLPTQLFLLLFPKCNIFRPSPLQAEDAGLIMTSLDFALHVPCRQRVR